MSINKPDSVVSLLTRLKTTCWVHTWVSFISSKSRLILCIELLEYPCIQHLQQEFYQCNIQLHTYEISAAYERPSIQRRISTKHLLRNRLHFQPYLEWLFLVLKSPLSFANRLAAVQYACSLSAVEDQTSSDVQV